MSPSHIEWTDESWNPVIGCSKVSPGCQNCYAVNMANRIASIPTTATHYRGLTVKHPNGKLDWSGEVRCLEHKLEIPLRWKKPRRIFVNSMSDLFHPDVPFEFIDKVFAVMGLSRRHIYQVLTKRPGRMLEYMQRVAKSIDYFESKARDLGYTFNFKGVTGETHSTLPFPLPNVWLGVSVENQATADERIPILLQTPAAVRWLSCEPLLGQVEMRYDFLPRMESLAETIDWVVCGGESGPNARPMHPDWARSLRDQCKAANVPFYMKQIVEGRSKLLFHKFPPDLQVREWPA